MPKSLRVRSLCLAAALIGLAVASPVVARSGFWNIGEARAELAAAEAASAALADRDEYIVHRIRIKEDLVADLIAGRTDLATVTARFAELNAHEPGYCDVLRATVPGETDTERAARNVIEYAVPRAAPAARSSLRARLEAEFARGRDVR